MNENTKLVVEPIRTNNPITVQILGICSALAVTTSITTALTMCAALSFVLCSSSVLISLLRHNIPKSTRLIIQITIIASLVIVVDLILKAYYFEVSQRLSVFVSLIVTNCLVLGRAEAFAMHKPALPSLMDAIGNSIGYSVILILVAAIRELGGAGTLMDIQILPLAAEQGWFVPIDFMLKAPSAFFIIALMVWAGSRKVAKPGVTEQPHETKLVQWNKVQTDD